MITGFAPLWPEYIAVFIFGSMIGSFLNVVIYRLPRGESLAWPGSHCPHCNRAIKPWENIPILSFLALRGRCAGCKKAISWQYPLVEAVTGGLMALLLWKFGWSYELMIYGVMAALLVALSGIDIATMRLPNQLTLSGAIAAIVLTLVLRREEWLGMVLGSLTGLGLLGVMGLLGRLLFKKETLGMGDIKLAGMMGLYLGPAHTAGMFILGVFIGAIVGGSLMLVVRRGWGQKIPFGPYLAAGGLVSLIWGESIWLWYVRLAMH
jgi:leader peptidase (prepilin peptidase) / N-methyltransferase